MRGRKERREGGGEGKGKSKKGERKGQWRRGKRRMEMVREKTGGSAEGWNGGREGEGKEEG